MSPASVSSQSSSRAPPRLPRPPPPPSWWTVPSQPTRPPLRSTSLTRGPNLRQRRSRPRRAHKPVDFLQVYVQQLYSIDRRHAMAMTMSASSAAKSRGWPAWTCRAPRSTHTVPAAVSHGRKADPGVRANDLRATAGGQRPRRRRPARAPPAATAASTAAAQWRQWRLPTHPGALSPPSPAAIHTTMQPHSTDEHHTCEITTTVALSTPRASRVCVPASVRGRQPSALPPRAPTTAARRRRHTHRRTATWHRRRRTAARRHDRHAARAAGPPGRPQRRARPRGRPPAGRHAQHARATMLAPVVSPSAHPRRPQRRTLRTSANAAPSAPACRTARRIWLASPRVGSAASPAEPAKRRSASTRPPPAECDGRRISAAIQGGRRRSRAPLAGRLTLRRLTPGRHAVVNGLRLQLQVAQRDAAHVRALALCAPSPGPRRSRRHRMSSLSRILAGLGTARTFAKVCCQRDAVQAEVDRALFPVPPPGPSLPLLPGRLQCLGRFTSLAAPRARTAPAVRA